jgi:very-short-patch-repair endonuclease
MSERPYNATLTSRARELRTNATKQENRLWYEFLRDFRPRFTRQRIVGSYILDFYCGAVKLTVELDGSGHFEPEAIEYDKIRTKFLGSLGIRVMRFTNIDVNESFEGVCICIANEVNALLGQPPPSADGTPFVREGGSGGTYFTL